jgi:acetylglutamate kinase
VNLATDFDRIARDKILTARQMFLLTHARQFISRAPQTLHVSFTSPLQLLPELFTVKGAGTLIKRGSTIRRHDGWEGIDGPRLRSLFESSFGRLLRPSFFDRKIACIYVEEAYRGAAVVQDTPLGGYLGKFAVDRPAQGEGIGRDLWELVIGDFPRLFWRARPDNPVVSWYIQQCDGMARLPDWHVFWRQIPVEQVASAVAFALEQPRDFADPSLSPALDVAVLTELGTGSSTSPEGARRADENHG